jgi:hypothetical protein
MTIEATQTIKIPVQYAALGINCAARTREHCCYNNDVARCTPYGIIAIASGSISAGFH